MKAWSCTIFDVQIIRVCSVITDLQYSRGELDTEFDFEWPRIIREVKVLESIYALTLRVNVIYNGNLYVYVWQGSGMMVWDG